MQTNANGFVLNRQRAVVGDEVQVRQARRRRHDLGAADDQPLVGLLLDVHVHVLHFVERPIAIDRRIDDGVVDEGDLFLDPRVPALRVLLVRLVERRVGAQRREKRRLVVGAAADPAIRNARPFGDRVAVGHHLLDVARGAKELVGVAAAAGVGGSCEHVLAGGIVQRVVQPRDHAHRVPERRMRRHVLDALAVNPDLAAVAQALEILVAGERPLPAGRCSRSSSLTLQLERLACPIPP